jgi:hypothetical protein
MEAPMKTTHFLPFAVFATAMLAFFACSSNDEPSNDSGGKYACYIDASDLTIDFTDEIYGPGHGWCYDYSEPSMQKFMPGCLIIGGGEALEECPQGYVKRCKETMSAGFFYDYKYGEKFKENAYCINKQAGCFENTGICENSKIITDIPCDIKTNISCNEIKYCYMKFFLNEYYSCYLIDGENKDNFYKNEQDCLEYPGEVYTQEQCIDAGVSFDFLYGV